jgi:hypothetical protein
VGATVLGTCSDVSNRPGGRVVVVDHDAVLSRPQFSCSDLSVILALEMGSYGLRTGVALAMLCGWLSGGCAGTLAAENAFSTDFECNRTHAKETPGGRYVVHGCGRRAVYVCHGETCALQTVTERDTAPSSTELSRAEETRSQPR